MFCHYWVVAKLCLTAFATTILLMKLGVISHAARLAAQDDLQRGELSTLGMELTFHAAAGLLVLLVPTLLSVYKPAGLTPCGRSERHGQTAASRKPELSSGSRWRIPKPGMTSTSRGSVTLTFNRFQVIGLAAAIVVVHLLVFHLTGSVHVGH